jgi:hypothetical protein
VKIGNNTSVQDAAHIGVEGAAVVLGDDVVVCTCRCPSRCSRPGHSFDVVSAVRYCCCCPPPEQRPVPASCRRRWRVARASAWVYTRCVAVAEAPAGSRQDAG